MARAKIQAIQPSLFLHSAQWTAWVTQLTEQYCYPLEQIDAGVDVLSVFRDAAKRQPLLLVCNNGGSQNAAETAGAAGFEFLAVGTAQRYHVTKLRGFAGESSDVSDIPTWMPQYRRTGLVPRRVQLLPFRSEEALRSAFSACHDAIYKTMANDPAATFDLMLIALTAKVLDEIKAGEHCYRFACVKGEADAVRSERLKALFTEAAEWLDANTPHKTAIPVLSPALSTTLLSTFEDYSLTLTAVAAGGTDIVGTAYETIVGSTFRGELGSYFTPRTIADFVARVVGIDSGRVLDPACGSGGLLLAVRRMLGDQAPRVQLFGNDLNPRMARAAKVNFLLHGLAPEQILQGDGLEVDRILRDTTGHAAGKGVWWDAIPDGPFDAVLANPPFAGHETDHIALERTESAHRRDGSIRSLNRTLPFIEAIVASLRVGGMAGLVIPTSVLNAEEESFLRFRALMLQRVELVAIIGLPEKAFVHTDCGVHGALLFVRRVAKPRKSYPVYVDWARNLGYDRLGRHSQTNDFPKILERYRSKKWDAANTFNIGELLSYGRIDPEWLQVVRSLPQDGEGPALVRLTELIEVRDARFSKRTIRDDETYRFFEVGDADMETGEIVRVREASGFELSKKGRIRNQVKAGDLLLPNHRDSLIAKGAPNGRAVVVVRPEHDGLFTTDRFLVLRPLVAPELARGLLNAASLRRQIVAQCRGAASLDVREKTLASLLVPKELLDGQAASAVVELTGRVMDLRRDLRAADRALEETIEMAFGTGDRDFRPSGWSDL